MANELAALSNELAAAVEQAGKSVVAVHARPRFSSSGVFWKPGVIVTAEHAIRREEEIMVTLPDGKNAPAVLVGSDAGTDIAVLKVDVEGAPVQPAKAAPVAGPRGDADLGRILKGQHVPAGDRADGLVAPARDEPPHGHLFVGEEAPGTQFAAAISTEVFEAHGFTRDHAFEDRGPLFESRASSNVPRVCCIAIPARWLPRGRESYWRRAGPGFLR